MDTVECGRVAQCGASQVSSASQCACPRNFAPCAPLNALGSARSANVNAAAAAAAGAAAASSQHEWVADPNEEALWHNRVRAGLPRSGGPSELPRSGWQEEQNGVCFLRVQQKQVLSGSPCVSLLELRLGPKRELCAANHRPTAPPTPLMAQVGAHIAIAAKPHPPITPAILPSSGVWESAAPCGTSPTCLNTVPSHSHHPRSTQRPFPRFFQHATRTIPLVRSAPPAPHPPSFHPSLQHSSAVIMVL